MLQLLLNFLKIRDAFIRQMRIGDEKMFNVKKRTLLLIAGIVWLIAGFNVARLGVLSYLVIDSHWF